MPRFRSASLSLLLCLLALGTLGAGPAGLDRSGAPATATGLAFPILFVGQLPIPADFTTIGSVFGNHLPDVQSAGRGGDLYLLQTDGQLRNLTREAGFGSDGFQGANAIAVRDPAVHWNGTRALFSMVIGAPTQQYQQIDPHWQIYEVTGLGGAGPVAISRLATQPAGYNNVSPLYSPDGRILFTTDRPRGGEAHLHPQLDEYEEAPTNTGLWSLDPASGDLRLLDHVPSGAFTPTVDSFGRVIYTRWDHLQRDQQADGDDEGAGYGTFDYADESANAARLEQRVEVFPEPRSAAQAVPPFETHTFNQFFPWQINPDGTESETLNHLGRHELHRYFNRNRGDDGNLVEFLGGDSRGGDRFNPNSIQNLLQIREDPAHPGRYLGIDAPEFQTHAAGRLVALDAPPGRAADQIAVVDVTHETTGDVTPEGGTPPAGHSGHYRDPLPLADGSLLAAHTSETRADANTGTRNRPGSRYAFRIKRLVAGPGGVLVPGAPLTAGIRKTVSYWDPDEKVDFTGELWELQPVEVRPRPLPPVRTTPLPAPEQQVFQQEGVNLATFQAWLRARNLAVLVSRDVTNRDAADRQQPFNLRIPGGHSTIATGGRVYDVNRLQIFQADQLRGLGGVAEPRRGRRVLARALHGLSGLPGVQGQSGADQVQIAADGSVAAFVPARRALSWQLLDAQGEGVVRERYWLTFQPGEVRTCTSCHGPSSRDQLDRPAPQNPPAALASLLRAWKAETQSGSCQASATQLCLANGRFRLSVSWRDFAGNTGVGRTLPLTSDTGSFWFFDPANVELVVKVLDGRGLNGQWWVFYGALSNVEYTLTVLDTATGRTKTYTNPSGRFASAGDTAAFPEAPPALLAPPAPVAMPLPALQPAPSAACTPTGTALCLAGGRFRVEATWKDFQGNTGTGATRPLTADTGAFSFFTSANLELMVKVLDGRPLNGKWWVFYGALSNVEYTLKVTDTVTGATKTYQNPSGRFASAGDTSALPGN